MFHHVAVLDLGLSIIVYRQFYSFSRSRTFKAAPARFLSRETIAGEYSADRFAAIPAIASPPPHPPLPSSRIELFIYSSLASVITAGINVRLKAEREIDDHRHRASALLALSRGQTAGGKSEVDDGIYYLNGVFAREYSFINCTVGRGHKSGSPECSNEMRWRCTLSRNGGA